MSSIDLEQSPEFHESVTINHLPNETLLSIFQHLNIKDIIRCRLVCKRFMLLCDEVRVPEIIIATKIGNITERWFYTDRPFNYSDDAIEPSTFNALRTKFQFEKFLKRLHFEGDYTDYEQLKLNNFTQLEELKLKTKVDASVELALEDNAIRLPNLKILDILDFDLSNINEFVVHDLKIVLKTPRLEALKCCDMFTINLSHPDTIAHLEVSYVGVPLGTQAHLLTNLRYLKIQQNTPIYDDILLMHPRLRTLVCNDFCVYGRGVIHRLSELRSYVEQKQILERPELQIFLHSVELVDAKKLDELKSTRSVLEFQMKNYDTLCDYIDHNDNFPLVYNELMELVKDRSLPNDFFKKFRNIQSVKVSGEVNGQHLLQFIKRMECFRQLHLKDARLDQSFFDGLYELTELSVVTMRNSSTLIVSYDFLFKLKQLKTFVIDHDSPEFFDFTLRLFNELKYLEAVDLHRYRDNEIIEIFRNIRDPDGCEFRRFELHPVNMQRRKLQINFEHVIRFVNAHKNGTLVGNCDKTLQLDKL